MWFASSIQKNYRTSYEGVNYQNTTLSQNNPSIITSAWRLQQNNLSPYNLLLPICSHEQWFTIITGINHTVQKLNSISNLLLSVAHSIFHSNNTHPSLSSNSFLSFTISSHFSLALELRFFHLPNSSVVCLCSQLLFLFYLCSLSQCH